MSYILSLAFVLFPHMQNAEMYVREIRLTIRFFLFPLLFILFFLRVYLRLWANLSSDCECHFMATPAVFITIVATVFFTFNTKLLMVCFFFCFGFIKLLLYVQTKAQMICETKEEAIRIYCVYWPNWLIYFNIKLKFSFVNIIYGHILWIKKYAIKININNERIQNVFHHSNQLLQSF